MADWDQGYKVFIHDAQVLADVLGNVHGARCPAGAEAAKVGSQQEVLHGRRDRRQGQRLVELHQIHVHGDKHGGLVEHPDQRTGVPHGLLGRGGVHRVRQPLQSQLDDITDQLALLLARKRNEVPALLARPDGRAEGSVQQLLHIVPRYRLVGELADGPSREDSRCRVHHCTPQEQRRQN